ncbi:MAG: IPT/TIG domain-containing protein [Terriglobales bacterium]
MKLAPKLVLAGALLNLWSAASDSPRAPEILRISPTSGPEGTRVEVSGRNLREVTQVVFGDAKSDFKLISPDKLAALVPHRISPSVVRVVTPYGRASSPFPFAVLNDPRIPEEVSYKSGYVNSVPAPVGFSSAMLWGIAIADTRVPRYQAATVEIAWTQLSCRIDGRDVVLNDDAGKLRGGLFRRSPWFGTNQNEAMQPALDDESHAVILPVGQRADRVWHFWSASPRATLPPGKLEGCTVRARVKISSGALLQIGMDYWRNPIIGYGPGGNSHEAGASNWYFPSERWQEAVFTDIGGPQF